jgi:signal peptidase
MRTLTRAVGRHLQQVLLTIAAVLGTACLLGTLAAPLLGVRPLIFMSGSMEPTIPTGSLGFAKIIPADQIRVGDVVTVPVADSYVTHRVVAITRNDATATLRLQGDGNKESDPTLHQVTEVPRVFAFVPELGTAVAWLSRAPGVYVLAGYVVLALGMLRRNRDRAGRGDLDGSGGRGGSEEEGRPDRKERTPPERPRLRVRRRRAAVAAAAAMVASLVAAQPAYAYFVDTVSVTGATLRTVTPAAPVVSCGATGVKTVTLNWTSVPNATGYRTFSDAGGTTVQDVSAGTTSMTFVNRTAGTFFVRTIYGNTSWLSVASNSKDYESSGPGTCS